MIVLLLCLPLAAYLLGSVSFAWLAARLKGVDLRQHGSGNLGATNAGRVLGAPWFVTVFLADVAKGLAPVLAALYLPGWLAIEGDQISDQILPILSGLGAILGHVFTLYHGLRGGKAVATSLGVLCGLFPLLAAAVFGVWIMVWLIAMVAVRMSANQAVSPASILAAAAAPMLHYALSEDPFAPGQRILSAFIFLVALLVLVRHRSNLRELLRRGEPHASNGDQGQPPTVETQAKANEPGPAQGDRSDRP